MYPHLLIRQTASNYQNRHHVRYKIRLQNSQHFGFDKQSRILSKNLIWDYIEVFNILSVTDDVSTPVRCTLCKLLLFKFQPLQQRATAIKNCYTLTVVPDTCRAGVSALQHHIWDKLWVFFKSFSFVSFKMSFICWDLDTYFPFMVVSKDFEDQCL